MTALVDDGLDMQVDLLRYFGTENGAIYAQSEVDQAIGPLFPDYATDEERNVDGGALFRMILREANVFAVSADIVGVLDACHHSVPPYKLHESDLPTTAGFAWLEKPVVVVDDTPERKPVVVRAFSWAVVRDRIDRPGVILLGWTQPEDERDHAYAQFAANVPLTKEVGCYPPHGLWAMISGLWPMGHDFHTSDMFRLFSTFLRFIGEPWTTDAYGQPSRPARRRAEREAVDSLVRVIRLRRRAPDGGGQHTGVQAGVRRNWSHRWMVGLPNGRWRNQWYPSKGLHRPKLILPYPKGPADKELVVKTPDARDVVYRVDR